MLMGRGRGFALLGTVVGFFLGWFKELMQSRPKLKTEIKSGKLNYIKQDQNNYGNIVEKKVEPQDANKFQLYLNFDIFNVGN